METGSSPLTRGKQGGYRVNGRGLRLIPAHAGKTCATSTGNSHAPAHPRSRGENMRLDAAESFASGSSPLTRGKRGRVGGDAWRGRLIPAHAGKTRLKISRTCLHRAHPRSRGENRPRTAVLPALCGSSPLTRGKRHPVGGAGGGGRLIPAHAGKTPKRRATRTTDQAHPRSRGENSIPPVTSAAWRGSSPLTRGKPDGKLRTSGMSRLIPAHAGKTLSRAWTGFPRWAHPRSRGENMASAKNSSGRMGSSPLTRGKPLRC